VSYYIIHRFTYHRNIISRDNHLLCVTRCYTLSRRPDTASVALVPTYNPPIYLPTYQPTNQPIYLPTYTVDVVHARVELNARQQRTPSFIEPVLKKPLRLPLNPYPQPATIVSDVVLYYMYVCSVAVLFFCFEFFYHYYYSFPTRPRRPRALFRSDLAVGKRRLVEGKGGELAQRRYTTAAAAANVRSEQCVYVRVFLFYQSTKNIILKL